MAYEPLKNISWQNRSHFLLSIALVFLSIVISVGEKAENLIAKFLPFMLLALSLLLINTHRRKKIIAKSPIDDPKAKVSFFILATAAGIAFAVRLTA